MNLAIYGGSFDPPHKGHIAIIEKALATLDIDLLIIVVAYQNPFKKGYRNSATKRLEWLRTLTKQYQKVLCSDYEIAQNRPVPTIESARYFQQLYQPTTMYLLLGQDNFLQLHKWHDFESLRQLFCFVVFERILDAKSNIYNGDNAPKPHNKMQKHKTLRQKIAKALHHKQPKSHNTKMPKKRLISYIASSFANTPPNPSYTPTIRTMQHNANMAICAQFAQQYHINARYIAFLYPYSSSLIADDITHSIQEIPKSIRNEVLQSMQRVKL